MYAKAQAFVEEQLMRDLECQTRSIARVGFAPTCTPMLHILEYRQRIANRLVVLVTLDVRYETNAASVALEARIVQT